MEKKKKYLAVLLWFCCLLLLPGGAAKAAAVKVRSIGTIYQNSRKVTGKATPGHTVKLRIFGSTYKAQTAEDGSYTFRMKETAPIGTRATVTIYDGKKAVHKKTVSVKGKLAFRVTGYDAMSHTVRGQGTAGKKVRIKLNGKTYTTRVKSDGTWKRTISSLKKNTKVKVSQQTTGTSYSKAKTATLKKPVFDMSLLKKGSRAYTYYTSGYQTEPKKTWVSFRAREVIGNKMYFEYEVCEIKDGKGTPVKVKGVGNVTGKNKMKFNYMPGISAKFTWKDAKTLVVEASAPEFGVDYRREVLTAK
jgi:hypothetical protein